MSLSPTSRAQLVDLVQTVTRLAQEHGIEITSGPTVCGPAPSADDTMVSLLKFGASCGMRLDASAKNDMLRNTNEPARHVLRVHGSEPVQLIAQTSLTKGGL